jgi:hypothetical protein
MEIIKPELCANALHLPNHAFSPYPARRPACEAHNQQRPSFLSERPLPSIHGAYAVSPFPGATIPLGVQHRLVPRVSKCHRHPPPAQLIKKSDFRNNLPSPAEVRSGRPSAARRVICDSPLICDDRFVPVGRLFSMGSLLSINRYGMGPRLGAPEIDGGWGLEYDAHLLEGSSLHSQKRKRRLTGFCAAGGGTVHPGGAPGSALLPAALSH